MRARAERDRTAEAERQALAAEIARLTTEMARLSSAAEKKDASDDDAAFIALLKDSHHAGAMRLLGHNGAFDDDEDPSSVTSVASYVVADELIQNPCTALNLIEAAEAAGERWALERWGPLVFKLQAEREAARKAANPPTPMPEPVVPKTRRRKAAVTSRAVKPTKADTVDIFG